MMTTRIGSTFLAAIAVILLAAPPADAKAKAKDAAKTSSAQVDLNSASQADLEALPGVGAATAKKIVAGRPYSSVSDLSRAGVSAKTIEKITPLVTVGKAPAPAASAPAMGKTEKSGKAKASASAEKAPKIGGAAAAAPAGPVDLNSASQKDLEALPAVGAATAKKIIANRPYSAVSDLSKAGVSAKTIEKITPLVTVGRASSPAAAPVAPMEKPAKSRGASPATAAPSSAPPASAQAQTPPAPGMVWVNTATRVFHREGDPWYGKTKQGKYMTEADAVKAGYRASKEGAPKK